MHALLRLAPWCLTLLLIAGVVRIARAHPGHAGHDSPAAAATDSSESPASSAGSDASPGRGLSRYEVLAAGLTVFVLAIFVGFEVIAKVPPTLHTPLMSGSNAISGITVVGAILAAGRTEFDFATVVAITAVALAMTNVVGGFVVTDRILRMFKRRA